VSVGVSTDGRYVYLAGAPDATADGSRADAPASLIVADASNGAVRVICGSIGQDVATIVR
jgi:hypothetical protein